MGEKPKTVQERLGHNQISVTMDTYSHVLPSAQRQAADCLGEALRSQEDGKGKQPGGNRKKADGRKGKASAG